MKFKLLFTINIFFALFFGVGFTASLLAQLSGSVNALGWSNPVLHRLPALAVACLLFARPQAI